MSRYRGTLKSASWPLQQAIYARLSSDQVLSNMVSGVFDEIEEGTPLPYVHIGDETTSPYDTKTDYGEDFTVTLHVFSKGPGKAEAKRIMDVILQSLTAAPLAVAGFAVDGIEREFLEVFHDGAAYHGVCRFRVYIKQ